MQVIHGGAEVFNALLYQDQHPSNVGYFQRQIQNFATNLTDAGKAFYQGAVGLFEKYHGDEAVRIAKAAVRKVQSIWERDDVRLLTELEKIQQAKPQMQRNVMAFPGIRKLYHEQRVDGYSDQYVDLHPGVIGEQHYDYQRVLNGLMVEQPGGDWKITCFIEDLVEGDRPLDLAEQVDVVDTWGWIDHYLRTGDSDPVSAYGTKR